MVLNQDFREFVELLNSNQVRYLVIGGYALAVHGHPRYTKDMDIWIAIDADNAARVLNVLHEFGFAQLDLTAQDFLTLGNVIQLGYPPHRIDILTQATGIDFEECFLSKISLDINGLMVHFIDIEHLKQNKFASGRPQDLVDISYLTQSVEKSQI